MGIIALHNAFTMIRLPNCCLFHCDPAKKGICGSDWETPYESVDHHQKHLTVAFVIGKVNVRPFIPKSAMVKNGFLMIRSPKL
jgi:hypothetical protein